VKWLTKKKNNTKTQIENQLLSLSKQSSANFSKTFLLRVFTPRNTQTDQINRPKKIRNETIKTTNRKISLFRIIFATGVFTKT
jgi:hypothetical protein